MRRFDDVRTFLSLHCSCTGKQPGARMPMMAMPGVAARGSTAMTELGKGLDSMMKRMTMGPVVKSRPPG